MSNTFVMSSRQAAELDYAFERNGFTPADVKTLSEGTVLSEVLAVLRKRSAITPIAHVIDLDADPFTPNGWTVEQHQKGGAWQFNADEISFYLSKKQKGGNYIEGNKLRKELEGQPVLNANVLDYLLANPHLIPESWKKDEQGNTRYIFFWGTVYRHSDGDLYVRYLFWDGDRWDWSDFWLGFDFYGNIPAAVRAS